MQLYSCPKVLLNLKPGLPKSDMYIVVPGKQVTPDHFNIAVSPGVTHLY